MQQICVFCGSGNDLRSIYIDNTIAFAKILANRRVSLVFGGGRNGLMGVLANAFINEGGHIIGVIPESLYKIGVYHKAIQDLRVVKTLHERKALMEELSEGFIALPGGYGTLEEFSEVISWAQLGLHEKPCALLNIDGYYDELLKFFDKSIDEGFTRVPYKDLIIVESDPQKLIDSITNYRPIHIDLEEEVRKMGTEAKRRKE